MKRRNFIQLGVGAGLVASWPSLAEPRQLPITADLIYSQNSQGRWAGKASTHTPTIEIDKTDGSTKIHLITAHEMNGYDHYIVKHVLLDKQYQFMAEHLFNPTQENVARSVFTVGNYTGLVYALSLCNKHDLWLNTTEL